MGFNSWFKGIIWRNAVPEGEVRTYWGFWSRLGKWHWVLGRTLYSVTVSSWYGVPAYRKTSYSTAWICNTKEIRTFETSGTKRASHLWRRQISAAPLSETLVSRLGTVLENKNIVLWLIFFVLRRWGQILARGCAPVGRTPLDDWSARRRELYWTTHDTHKRKNSHATGGIPNPWSWQASGRRLTP